MCSQFDILCSHQYKGKKKNKLHNAVSLAFLIVKLVEGIFSLSLCSMCMDECMSGFYWKTIKYIQYANHYTVSICSPEAGGEDCWAYTPD